MTVTIEVSPLEKALLDYLRTLGYSRVTIYVKDGVLSDVIDDEGPDDVGGVTVHRRNSVKLKIE